MIRALEVIQLDDRYLSAAAGILAIEAYHAGVPRALPSFSMQFAESCVFSGMLRVTCSDGLFRCKTVLSQWI